MKKILLLLLCFITACPSFCQVDDKKENELLIVALDVRSRVKTYWSASSISNCISGILAKNNIQTIGDFNEIYIMTRVGSDGKEKSLGQIEILIKD